MGSADPREREKKWGRSFCEKLRKVQKGMQGQKRKKKKAGGTKKKEF